MVGAFDAMNAVGLVAFAVVGALRGLREEVRRGSFDRVPACRPIAAVKALPHGFELATVDRDRDDGTTTDTRFSTVSSATSGTRESISASANSSAGIPIPAIVLMIAPFAESTYILWAARRTVSRSSTVEKSERVV